MTHVITLLFLPFQLNFVTLLSYHTFVPLPLIMTPSVSHLPTLFRYHSYNWLKYLLAEANQNQNGDSISLNLNPISVASYLHYIRLNAWQYIYIYCLRKSSLEPQDRNHSNIKQIKGIKNSKYGNEVEMTK